MKKVLIIFIFMLSLISASALFPATDVCFQETANVSTTCGGSASGSYNIPDSANWYNPYATIDGNYATEGYYTLYGGSGQILIVYRKHPRSNGAVWQIKGNSGIRNLTIPDSCFNFHGLNLLFRVTSDTLSADTIWSCLQFGGDNVLYTDTALEWVYEEGVYWNTTDLIYDTGTYYVNNTLENTYNIFQLNVTYDSSYLSSVTAQLLYNNTLYSSTKTGSGENITFTNYFKTPLVNVDTNITFKWLITTFNGTGYEYYNTSNYNQTVRNFVLDDCNATYTYKIFNFTNYDEDNPAQKLITPANNNTFSGEIYLEDVLFYSKNKTNVNEFSICSNINVINNVSLDGTIRYDGGTNYVTEYYNLQNFNLNQNTSSNNISLYNLAVTNSEECLINVKDSNYIPYNDLIIDIQRKYINEGLFRTVEKPKTYSQGNAIGHFVLNEEIYNIILRNQGNLVASYNEVIVVKSTGSDCILNLNLQGLAVTPADYESFKNVLYEPIYNASTNIYSVEWLSNDGSSITVILNASVEGTSVCSETISATSGTSNCNFASSFENKTAFIQFYSGGELVYSDYVSLSYKKPNLNPIRYIVVAILIPMLVLLGGTSISIAVIFYIIGLIISGGMMLFDTQSFLGTGSFIVWLIIGAIILLIKFAGGKKNG